LEELTKEWKGLEARARTFNESSIPAYNKKLWEAGIGAVWKK
jgi:hypothetical protein